MRAAGWRGKPVVWVDADTPEEAEAKIASLLSAAFGADNFMFDERVLIECDECGDLFGLMDELAEHWALAHPEKEAVSGGA